MTKTGEQPQVAGEEAPDPYARMSSLVHFVSLVAAAGGYTELLRLMAEESCRALAASMVSLSVWERDRGVLRTLVNAGDLGPDEQAMPSDECYPLAEHPLAERMTVSGVGYLQTVGDSGANPQIERVLAASGKYSCVGVPVWFEGRVWGELWATRAWHLGRFGDSDLEFASLVAAQVGAGIAQAEHLARVERLAYTDALTGLANRRAFEDRLDSALVAHRLSATPVGIVVADVNGLKRINDSLGHVAGDRALVNFAGELSAATSALPNAVAARLGGDEFCVLTLGASADQVKSLAEDVCRRARLVLDEGIACGAATTDPPTTSGVTPAQLLRAADAAQYRAKRSGSDGPVVAGHTFADGTASDVDGGPERRSFRRRGELDPGQLLDEVIRRLDLADEIDSLTRLGVVARLTADTVDAASCWISSKRSQDAEIVTRDATITRRPDDSAADAYYDCMQPETYRPEDYPATFAAFAGRCILVDVDDPRSDPAEVSLLTGAGMTELMMSGYTDRDGTTWLVEILGDHLTAPMRTYASALRAAIALAIHH